MTVSRVWNQNRAFPWPKIEWPTFPLVPPLQHAEWWPISRFSQCRMLLWRDGEFLPAFVIRGPVPDKRSVNGLTTKLTAISWTGHHWFHVELTEDEDHMATCEFAQGRDWYRLFENVRKDRARQEALADQSSLSLDGDSGVNPSSSSD